jgi:integrase
MFRWALSQDIVEADPTAGLTPYDRGAPRDRVLTVEEIELVWKWLDTDALSLEAADILKLELLLGARCGEISGLRAEEIDRQKWSWTLPVARSKKWASARHADCGPRARDARTRLSGVEKGPLFLLDKGVVVTSAHIGHYLLTRRTTLPIAVFTSHDLRRTFTTMLAEMGVALDLVAAIVGHESSGKDTRTLVRHYVHTDMLERKARALRAWDEQLRRMLSGEAKSASVVEI